MGPLTTTAPACAPTQPCASVPSHWLGAKVGMVGN
eukprot:COSAG01_NODE_22220_length_866_cov_1.027379_2_plen_35_part_01